MGISLGMIQFKGVFRAYTDQLMKPHGLTKEKKASKLGLTGIHGFKPPLYNLSIRSTVCLPLLLHAWDRMRGKAF